MKLNRFNEDASFSEYFSDISKKKKYKSQIIERIVEGKFIPNVLYNMEPNQLENMYIGSLNEKIFTNCYLNTSNISGKGIFARTKITENTNLGIGLIKISDTNNPDNDYVRTVLGQYVNHSSTPNLKVEKINNDYFYSSLNDIEENEELTIDYTNFDFSGETDFIQEMKNSDNVNAVNENCETIETSGTISLLENTLLELKEKYLSSDAVKNIRIETDEIGECIVFDVECETDVKSVSEYNGYRLKYNHICTIPIEETVLSEETIEQFEKSEDEIILEYNSYKKELLKDFFNFK